MAPRPRDVNLLFLFALVLALVPFAQCVVRYPMDSRYWAVESSQPGRFNSRLVVGEVKIYTGAPETDESKLLVTVRSLDDRRGLDIYQEDVLSGSDKNDQPTPSLSGSDKNDQSPPLLASLLKWVWVHFFDPAIEHMKFISFLNVEDQKSRKLISEGCKKSPSYSRVKQVNGYILESRSDPQLEKSFQLLDLAPVTKVAATLASSASREVEQINVYLGKKASFDEGQVEVQFYFSKRTPYQQEAQSSRKRQRLEEAEEE